MTIKPWSRDLKEAESLVFDEESVILEFTEDLVTAMVKQKMKRSVLAKRIGTSKAYVTQVLKGETNISFRTAVLFANAVGLKFSARLRAELDEMLPIPQTPRQEAAGAVVLTLRRRDSRESPWQRGARTSAPSAFEVA